MIVQNPAHTYQMVHYSIFVTLRAMCLDIYLDVVNVSHHQIYRIKIRLNSNT